MLVEVRREDDSCYCIQVKDNGLGIRPEDLPRLFTEFGQVGEKTRGGTGLGLAITKRIVEATVDGSASKVCSVRAAVSMLFFLRASNPLRCFRIRPKNRAHPQ